MRRIVYTVCALIALILLLFVMPGCNACRGFVEGLNADVNPDSYTSPYHYRSSAADR